MGEEKKIGLRLHPKGYWYLCFERMLYYFGEDESQKKSEQDGPHLLNRLTIPVDDLSAKLKSLATLDKSYCEQKVQDQELSQRHLNDVISTLDRLIDLYGPDAKPSTWDRPSSDQGLRKDRAWSLEPSRTSHSQLFFA